jgi:hypothetical protein
MEQEMITITKAEYDQLCKDQFWLQCLEDAGVDNWEGIEEAIQLRRDDQNGDTD